MVNKIPLSSMRSGEGDVGHVVGLVLLLALQPPPFLFAGLGTTFRLLGISNQTSVGAHKVHMCD
jgi:hypothetical protein